MQVRGPIARRQPGLLIVSPRFVRGIGPSSASAGRGVWYRTASFFRRGRGARGPVRSIPGCLVSRLPRRGAPPTAVTWCSRRARPGRCSVDFRACNSVRVLDNGPPPVLGGETRYWNGSCRLPPTLWRGTVTEIATPLVKSMNSDTGLGPVARTAGATGDGISQAGALAASFAALIDAVAGLRQARALAVQAATARSAAEQLHAALLGTRSDLDRTYAVTLIQSVTAAAGRGGLLPEPVARRISQWGPCEENVVSRRSSAAGLPPQPGQAGREGRPSWWSGRQQRHSACRMRLCWPNPVILGVRVLPAPGQAGVRSAPGG